MTHIYSAVDTNNMLSIQFNTNYFFLAGINYHKADAELRGKFALSNEAYQMLLSDARSEGLNEVFVLSTCNRTEIYGVASDAQCLINFLCRYTEGSAEEFASCAYTKSCAHATEHLFRVASGLDSQILGDFEIVSQIKNAMHFTREIGALGAFMERLVTTSIQVSKLVKNNTAISNGTTSVSFAVIEDLKSQPILDFKGKTAVVLGLGEIGRTTALNLKKYLNIVPTVINRTDAVAAEFAQQHQLVYASFEDRLTVLQQADIIVVATAADKPTLTADMLAHTKGKIVFDLSMPRNVARDVAHLPQYYVADVDDLSKILNLTAEKRRAEVPKAEAIIKEQLLKLDEWQDSRKRAAVLETLRKNILNTPDSLAIHGCTHAINAKINRIAGQVQKRQSNGCVLLEVITENI